MHVQDHTCIRGTSTKKKDMQKLYYGQSIVSGTPG